MKRHGSQQDGVCQRAAQQRDPRMAARQWPQHTGPQGQGVPSAAVGAQGDLVGSTAAEVGPGVVVQLLAGVLFVIGQGDDVRRELLPCGSVGHTSKKSTWCLFGKRKVLLKSEQSV